MLPSLGIRRPRWCAGAGLDSCGARGWWWWFARPDVRFEYVDMVRRCAVLHVCRVQALLQIIDAVLGLGLLLLRLPRLRQCRPTLSLQRLPHLPGETRPVRAGVRALSVVLFPLDDPACEQPRDDRADHGRPGRRRDDV